MMKERLATLWEPHEGVAITEVQRGIFLFQFFHKLDMQHVSLHGPWHFDNHLLILSRLGDAVIPSQVPLFCVDFWVQVHDIPMTLMTETVGVGLGNFIGKFVEYDPKNNEGIWRKYMRLRVTLDVLIPLKRGKRVQPPDGQTQVVRFKYKRLTTFCFLCGLLGHLDNQCDKLYQMEEDDGFRGWNSDLKVERRKPGALGRCRWLREDRGGQWTKQGVTEGSSTDQTLHKDLENKCMLLEGEVRHSHHSLQVSKGLAEESEEAAEKKRKHHGDEGNSQMTPMRVDMPQELEYEQSASKNFFGVGPGYQAHQDQ
ncbi:unnamed protein product [Cuscuta epithymum]|uniref:CCHC-type domain-containing protein n=1 Tax=Cuscuta epithymum TaxID=186058 RepID=A0AAV0EUY9_9ASTE|nr:unnamed protein product [Cuscuta epithymum]